MRTESSLQQHLQGCFPVTRHCVTPEQTSQSSCAPRLLQTPREPSLSPACPHQPSAGLKLVTSLACCCPVGLAHSGERTVAPSRHPASQHAPSPCRSLHAQGSPQVGPSQHPLHGKLVSQWEPRGHLCHCHGWEHW